MTATLPTLSSASATLLAQLLDDPFDYDRRAILSDVLAENSEQLPEVELPRGVKVTRDQWGLPWGFRCTMAEWCGGGRCPRDMDRDGTCYYMCNVCRGTGRIPGIAAAVCGAWPITVVELTDREPLNETIRFAWYNPYLLKWYPTRDFAIAALSHAALTLGRRAAGLPPL